MGPRVFRGSESQQRGLAGLSRRPEAGVPPSHISSQTVLSRGPGAGIGRPVQPRQMETQPTPCQAQDARTSQEMGPCASLSVSQERAGHRNEPHPLPRGPEAPCKPSSPPGDMVQSQSRPPGTVRYGVVFMAAGRVEPHRALARGPSPSAGMCTPAFSSPAWEQGQKKGGGGGPLHSGLHLFRLPFKRASCPKEGAPPLVAAVPPMLADWSGEWTPRWGRGPGQGLRAPSLSGPPGGGRTPPSTRRDAAHPPATSRGQGGPSHAAVL